jgi:thiamine pyrophosphokinase
MNKCLILANGDPPPKKVMDFLDKKGFHTLICADGGANSALKYNLLPDYIVGDLDSIHPEVYDYFYNKCEIKQIKSQNDTDVEKCIKFAVKKKYDEIVLLGVTGDRLDHFFCNMGIVLKFYDKVKLSIVHKNSYLMASSGNIILKTMPKETISIYAIDKKTKITSEGLKYPLKNISLPFGVKESTSNVAIGNQVKLKTKNGKIFIIRDFNVMKKYDLF